MKIYLIAVIRGKYNLARYIVAFSCFILCSVALQAQRDLPLRIEFETAKDGSDYHFVNVGAHGCFIFYEGNVISKDSASWLFMYYDTNLIKQKNISIPLPISAQYVSSYCAENQLNILFFIKKPQKGQPTHYIVSINLLTQQTSLFPLQYLTEVGDYQFIHFAETILFYTMQEKESSLLFYNINTQQINDLSLQLTTPFSIESIEKDSIHHCMYITYSFMEDKKKSFILLQTDFLGNILHTLPFPLIEDFAYLSAKMARVDSNRFIFIGTYNVLQHKLSANLHSGVYTLLFENQRFQDPSFYNFTQLMHGDTNLVKNKKQMNLNLQLLVGNLRTNGEQYAFITEIFYPEYTQTGYSYIDPYTGFTPSTTAFAGYRFVNAYITSFDKEGKLLWHHYLPFEKMLTSRLTKRVDIYFENQHAVIYYPYLSELTYTRINGYRVLDKLVTVPIETSRHNDAVEYSKGLNMEHWVDNNFLIYGYQYIKNSTKGNKGKRYVFFVNKLKYL